MPSKKELQEQIDELKGKLSFKQNYPYSENDTDRIKKNRLINNFTLNSWGREDNDTIYECHIDVVELRKQFLALIDYLKLEYKVEDKHLEGFKKK